MIRIAGVVSDKSYSPELVALREYFSHSNEIAFELVPSTSAAAGAGFDAIYLKMGFSPMWKPSDTPEIHDYSSASTGDWPHLKDWIKSNLSRKPVLRSFLSEFVRTCLTFRDSIPYVVRDMGVPEGFISARESRTGSPTYDLLYAGSIGASRQTDLMLEGVTKAGLTILVVGEPSPEIQTRYGKSTGVSLAGRVSHHEIPGLAADCRMGLNFTPDIHPFNRQTSTKVLEYLALGLPVVTNDYEWVRQFELQSSASMFKFKSFDELTAIGSYDFHVPEMEPYSWHSVLGASGIAERIAEVLG